MTEYHKSLLEISNFLIKNAQNDSMSYEDIYAEVSNHFGGTVIVGEFDKWMNTYILQGQNRINVFDCNENLYRTIFYILTNQNKEASFLFYRTLKNTHSFVETFTFNGTKYTCAGNPKFDDIISNNIELAKAYYLKRISILERNPQNPLHLECEQLFRIAMERAIIKNKGTKLHINWHYAIEIIKEFEVNKNIYNILT